jgi:hypothetical protein
MSRYQLRAVKFRVAKRAQLDDFANEMGDVSV